MHLFFFLNYAAGATLLLSYCVVELGALTLKCYGGRRRKVLLGCRRSGAAAAAVVLDREELLLDGII